MPAQIGLLGLGSNVGERRARLQDAVDALPGVGVDVLACSCVYDTDPVGEVPDQASFLNACVRIETKLEPLALLDSVKDLERTLGRDADGVRHGPRTIDIDVLLLGAHELTHPRMTLPHEQLLSRRFVLIPALELDFALCTPSGISLAGALAALPLEEGVRWAGPPLTVPAHGSHGPHGSQGSHESRGSHETRAPHGSQGSYESHASHGSRAFYEPL